MTSKRILGIAGAAMVGTLAGTGAVHAYIGLSSDVNAEARNPLIVARESLDRNHTYSPVGEGTTYYRVSDATGSSYDTQVRVPLGMFLPDSSTALVTVELENLVVGADNAGTGLPTLIISPATVAATPATIHASVVTSVLTGGATGSKRVQFGVTVGATGISGGGVPADAVLVLSMPGGRYGVDPENAGTITITPSRQFSGATVTNRIVLRDVIKTERAVDVKVTPQDQIALVQEGFMKFKPGTGVSNSGDTSQLAAHVGNVRITLATTTDTFFDARAGQGSISAVSELVRDAAITFTGRTSFLEEDDDDNKLVYVSEPMDATDNPCATVGSSIQNDAGDLEAALNVVDGPHGGYFCLKVDGETEILETAYEVSITYTSALGAAAFFVPATTTHALGSIERDGAVVRIDYLTTNQKYNQRVVLVNRSSESVAYKTTFLTAALVDYTAGDDAEGTLSPNSRTVLEVPNMVTFDDGRTNADGTPRGSHGSAVLSIDVVPDMIEVVTVTTNMQDKSTDTVVWPPETVR